MKKNMLFLFLIFCWIDFIIGCGLVVAQNNNELQQFEDFLKLPDDQKQRIIVKSFEERINKSQNIYYKLDLTIGNSKNRQGVPDNNVDFFFKRKYTRWQLNKSYKVDMEMFKGIASQPIEWVTSVYDAKNGENRGIFRSSSLKDKIFGTINTIQDVTTTDDIYLYWLQDSFFLESSLEKNSFIFVYLLEHVKDWTFFTTEKENLIGLEVKFQPAYASFNFKSCNGTLKVYLNFIKGFMPELSEIRWDAIWANNKNQKAWRDEKFIVEKKFESRRYLDANSINDDTKYIIST
ncbi:MAG: hypothetical protein LBF88_03385 [Planctomycetaceae bacterium]|jgi:hypothetical protein|nr:hypothetical protein [Planctomycetaceae bacterium]